MTYTMTPFVFKQKPSESSFKPGNTFSPLDSAPQHELYALLINNFHFIHTVGPLLKPSPPAAEGLW